MLSRTCTLAVCLLGACSTGPVSLSDHPFRVGVLAGLESSTAHAELERFDVDVDADYSDKLFGGLVGLSVTESFEVGIRGHGTKGDATIEQSSGSFSLTGDVPIERWGIDGFLRYHLTDTGSVRPWIEAQIGGGKISFPEGDPSESASFWRVGGGLGLAWLLSPQLQLDLGGEAGWSGWSVPTDLGDLDFLEVDVRAMVSLSLRL